MNKQEALKELEHLQEHTSSADSIESVTWSRDIHSVSTLAGVLEIGRGEIQELLDKLYDGLVYDSKGARKGITWAQVYDLFQAMRKAIEAMP